MPNMSKPNSWDISAPSILPVLNDLKYQSLLCEYGGIFAAANEASRWVNSGKKRNSKSEKLQLIPSMWLGFISWKAADKLAELKDEMMDEFSLSLRNGSIPQDSVLYWGNHWNESLKGHFYEMCVEGHGDECLTVYSSTFAKLFGSNEMIGLREEGESPDVKFLPDFLFDMPDFPKGWSLCSYFIMSAPNLVEYARFGTAFFVTMESLYNIHDNSTFCPIWTWHWGNDLCWCFIMERLVNIWWYHAGKPILFLDRLTGRVEEFAPVEERQISPYFFPENLEITLREFRDRLTGRSLELYDNLAKDLY